MMSWDEIENWYRRNGYAAAAAAIGEIQRWGDRRAISEAIRKTGR